MPTRTIEDRMAIYVMDWEGYFEGSASFRNKNPGNLKAHGQEGVVSKDSQGHAIFDTFENGWNALVRQIEMMFNNTSRVYNNQMTLYEVFEKYAEANSKPYAEFVARRLEVTPDTKLADIG